MRVYKLISNTWVLQGNPAIFLPYSNYAYDLGVSNGEVYIAYPEFANVSVKKFNGSQWSYVGGQGIAYSSALKPRMEFDDLGNLYVLFNQFPGYLKVKMFDGTNWNLVGTGDFSESRTDDYDIATFGNGTVAVVFNAGGAFAKAVGPSVGIDEELNDVSRVAAVYPNPSSGIFNVEFSSPNDVEFAVTDIVGRLVVEGKVQRGNAIIDLSSQATGIYILRFEDGYSLKLVKQ